MTLSRHPGPFPSSPLLVTAWNCMLCFAALLQFVDVRGADRAISGQRSVLDSRSKAARTHWAFRSVAAPAVPRACAPARNPIDAFILERLAAAGLPMSPEADRASLLRRVSLVLTGLPPTPEALEEFVQSRDPQAYELAVERLLQSPQHGERWAQHWLDLVRYADTDGFEVNTERKNAWPYRDYVIRALNRDTPYDRFIREQLAGDALGEDAATGFLVTAAALLPGQIGQDDASKRLARQDELSEIVGNTGQTFLGLSIGCARCHSHKFDPIPHRDYYAMQAFFAGVRYGERASRSPEALALKNEAETLKQRVEALDDALARFEPLARVGAKPPRETNAKRNEDSFVPLLARFVRFTIHDANLHPTLGLIEPCIDEFEIFTAGSHPTNLALASAGAKVTASGSRVSDSHRLEYLHDGRPGNASSWMSDEPGRGSVLFELPKAGWIDKIVWSRDREGNFTDRLATAYTIEAGESLEAMRVVVDVPPLRPSLNARKNSDRFEPVAARRLRFTIDACSSLEPAIDEIEVLTAETTPRNAALSRSGARASASSTLLNSSLHRVDHLIDGQYGSARSWISGTPGKGWVEIEFAREERIERVVWGSDRERVVHDRIPTAYRIEVSDAAGPWRTVADGTDRRKYVPGATPLPAVSLVRLDAASKTQASQWMAEKKLMQSRIDLLFSRQLVFAGWFSEPDSTRLLLRGDPEQPTEEVVPAVLSALDSLALPATSSEQERRLALAAWMASPGNPLTARVIANRIWQWHFGAGLVETASDFGLNGGRPSHPELLDWLATELVHSGWSLKHLHRLIVHSATFRQSSRVNPSAMAKDADNRLLWRFPSRRLDSEVIRDSMLAVSARLNGTSGGPGFDLFKSRGGLNGFPPIESFSGNGLRRMVYAHKVRMESESVFGAFDCPDAGQSTPRRRQSTTPIQALNLFNSRFTLEAASAFATRVENEAGTGADVESKIRRAYQLALGRAPGMEESREASVVAREHGLAAVCRVLFNTSEFLFLP